MTRRAAAGAFLAPALLMLWSAYAIWATYSPTPYADQWNDLHLWRQFGDKGWFHYLWSQHFEHRIFFPRLVFTADLKWFRGRDVLNLVAIGLTQLTGAALFVQAARVRRPDAVGLLGLATALTLVFSLMQWENLFWGFQLQFVGVYAAAAWALYAFCMGSRDPQAMHWGWMAGALALLVLATFSMANGMLAGVAMLLVAMVTRRGLVATALAGIATAILMAVYLQGYETPAHHEAASLTQDPSAIVAYGATYLANIWGLGLTRPAVFIGLLGGGATAGMLLVMALDRSRDPARAALFGLALFVGMSVAVTSVGRVQLGLWSATSSRYTTATAYFWGAQAVFWTLTVQRASGSTVRTMLGAILAVAVLRLIALQSVGYDQVLAAHKDVVLASSVLLGDVEDGYALVPISAFVDRRIFYDGVSFIRSRRTSLFAEPAAATVGTVFRRPLAPPGRCRGAFETLDPAPSFGRPRATAPVWHARGWGWDAEAHRRLRRVVVVDGAGRVLGVGLSGLPRSDMISPPRWGSNLTSGWIASINSGAGGQAIAYGVTAAGAACELGRKAWPR